VVVVAARGRVVHATHVEYEIGASDGIWIAATHELYVTEGGAKDRVGEHVIGVKRPIVRNDLHAGS